MAERRPAIIELSETELSELRSLAARLSPISSEAAGSPPETGRRVLCPGYPTSP
jgi:hypothetical protein